MKRLSPDLFNYPNGFSSSKVLVVGDVMLDRYWYGNTNRISPEAPVPVVRIEKEDNRVGGAGNVALNAAALGARTYLLGLSGLDSAADEIEQLLKKNGVYTYLQRVHNLQTITKLRILAHHQQLIRLDFEDNFSIVDEDILISAFEDKVKHVDVVVLSDYAKGTLLASEKLIRIAKNLGKIVVVDPKGSNYEKYRGATIITPNLSEFEAIVGKCNSDSSIIDKAESLRLELELEAVLVTRSEKGMTLVANGHEPIHLQTRAQEVFDVTGAGDTVVASLAAALGAGISLPKAVTISNYAAGIAVGKLGTTSVSYFELKTLLDSGDGSRVKKICSETELFSLIQVAKSKGEKVVMTNGCFDILHPGHIDYLERARALGDRLIVAVNDDDSVRRLKGESRPVNSIESRVRMLLGLSCVDWIVVFSEDTPERLYCKMLPDILAKGGDYQKSQIAGSDCVVSSGGRVELLDFLPGYSTSALIEKIKNK